jgi:hypothetical protein
MITTAASRPIITTEIGESEKLSAVIRAIEEIGRLPKGWLYGDGVPASGNVVCLAEELANEALRVGLNKLDAFPGKDGQITVAIYVGDVDHSFQVQTNGTVRYWRETDPNSEEEILGFSEAFERIQTLSWTSCITFISDIGTQLKAIFAVKLSSPPVTEVESPWWSMDVSKTEPVVFANMPAHTIRPLAPNPQFFGGSTIQFFPKDTE